MQPSPNLLPAPDPLKSTAPQFSPHARHAHGQSTVSIHTARMKYLDTECQGGMAMDQVCDEMVIKEKVDTALLRMMMDLGYENIQPHHMWNMDLCPMSISCLELLVAQQVSAVRLMSYFSAF